MGYVGERAIRREANRQWCLGNRDRRHDSAHRRVDDDHLGRLRETYPQQVGRWLEGHPRGRDAQPQAPLAVCGRVVLAHLLVVDAGHLHVLSVLRDLNGDDRCNSRYHEALLTFALVSR